MKRSMLALIGSLFGLAYVACLCAALMLTAAPRMTTVQAAGYAIGFPALMPHLALAALANLMNWIGFAARKRGFALVAAMLYCASMPLMPALFPAALALLALALIDFAKPVRRGGRRAESASEPGTDLSEESAPDPEGEYETESEEESEPETEEEPDPEPSEAPAFRADPRRSGARGDPDGAPGRRAAPGSAGAAASARRAPLEEDQDDGYDGYRSYDRPRADGVSVFLGLLMALCLLALIGVVVLGLIGDALPFELPFRLR